MANIASSLGFLISMNIDIIIDNINIIPPIVGVPAFFDDF
jgi:hypothetical protein